MGNNLEKFIQSILYVNSNKDILEIYKDFLNKNSSFSQYEFIIGTNDLTYVADSANKLNYLNNKIYNINSRTLYTYNTIANFDYILYLEKTMKTQFSSVISLAIDTNAAGIISKFIETNGEYKNEFICDILNSNSIDLIFIFYLFENLYGEHVKKVTTKTKEIIKNLCKFNSLDRIKFLKNNKLEFNQKYFEQIHYFVTHNFSSEKEIPCKSAILKSTQSQMYNHLITIYNQIYSLLLMAFVEKNTYPFYVEKSILALRKVMGKYGIKHFSILYFIFNYFKNGNNAFFNAVPTQSMQEVKSCIANMSWDISFYHLSQISLSVSYFDANFGFPYFATCDKKFTQYYEGILQYKGAIITKTNNGMKKINYIRMPNEFDEILKEYPLYKGYCKEKNAYTLSLLLIQEAENKLSKFYK